MTCQTALTPEEVEYLYELVPAVKMYLSSTGMTPEELLSNAFAEFIENHPDPQALTNDSN